MWLDKLKSLKQKSGLTTKEISKGSGIPEPTLEKIFSGATKEPKLPTIQRLVHFLGYTLDDLEDAVAPPPEMFELSASEKQLIFDYRSLNNVGKQYIQQTMSIAVIAYKT